jgi:hypothetical protein
LRSIGCGAFWEAIAYAKKQTPKLEAVKAYCLEKDLAPQQAAPDLLEHPRAIPAPLVADYQN